MCYIPSNIHTCILLSGCVLYQKSPLPDLSQLAVPVTEAEARQIKKASGRSASQPTIESTSVAPRQRPKAQAGPPSTAGLGLPIQTTIAPRKRPTATTSNPQTPVGGAQGQAP